MFTSESESKLKQDMSYLLQVRLCINQKFFGPGVAQLMKLIDQHHSLQRATEEMGIAYSKAWRILKTAEENLGFPLLHKTVGGAGGGGSELTIEGRAFLEKYLNFRTALENHADLLFIEFFSDFNQSLK